MTIYGVALMAICSLIGVGIGDFLGDILHVKAKLGGVGFAMILLLMARAWLQRNKALSSGIVLAPNSGPPCISPSRWRWRRPRMWPRR